MFRCLSNVLKNGFTVANLRLWRHSPISVTLAVICWLLPVASIISPATSSVQLAPFNVYALKHIPRVDFTSANFASFISSLAINPRGPNFWSTLYNSHTAETQRVVNSVATQGTILPIDPPAVNSSWSVGFYRPAIVCDKVNQALATHITQNVAQAINRSKVLEADMLRFKSDMFTQRSNQLGPKPRDREDNVTVPSTASKPLVDGSPLSLFVATFPRATEYTEFDEALKNMDKAVQNSTILHCMLHNASYQASITFVDGEQTVHVTDQTVLNPIVYTIGVINHDNGKPTSNTSFVRNAQVMESFSY
ncbi:unnamed protein product [Aspergillus oryzae]|nr:unnamed protein product [Aspergillus oryzae]